MAAARPVCRDASSGSAITPSTKPHSNKDAVRRPVLRCPPGVFSNETSAPFSQCLTSHKLKGGIFPPEYELDCYKQLAADLDGDRFRFDPNGVWSTETAIWFGQQIEGIRNDYLEDPVFGMAGMRGCARRWRCRWQPIQSL